MRNYSAYLLIALVWIAIVFATVDLLMRTCQNCGRDHDSRLIETFIDGDGQPIEIIVCEQPRYKEKENV